MRTLDEVKDGASENVPRSGQRRSTSVPLQYAIIVLKRNCAPSNSGDQSLGGFSAHRIEFRIASNLQEQILSTPISPQLPTVRKDDESQPWYVCL
jgi:hypothetical protein